MKNSEEQTQTLPNRLSIIRLLRSAEILSELMAQLQNENAPAYKDLSKRNESLYGLYMR